MSILKKWLRRILVSAILIVVIFIALGIYAMNAMGQNDQKAFDELKNAGATPKIESVDFMGGKINTISVGDPKRQRVLFIHGSPGDWSAWKGFLQDTMLLDSFFMVAYDRCGYGKTTINAQAQLQIHGETAKAIMDQYGNDQKWMIVGHSYGGAVVAYLIANYPNKIERAVLAAGAISPEFQEPRWYNKLAQKSLVNKLIGENMRASNLEMIGLPNGLRLLEEKYQNSEVEQVFIQGKKDVLVPYESMDYWKSLDMPNVTYVFKDDMNHFIPWSNPELIIDALIRN